MKINEIMEMKINKIKEIKLNKNKNKINKNNVN